jgi:hypothetical protein
VVKVKDFWSKICEEMDYRFFTGIPYKAATDLYKHMDPNIMHYIPATSEAIAVKMATGTWISGFKSAVILDKKKLERVNLDFNIKNNVPILFITGQLPENLGKKGMFTSYDLFKVGEYIEKTSQPAVLTFS